MPKRGRSSARPNRNKKAESAYLSRQNKKKPSRGQRQISRSSVSPSLRRKGGKYSDALSQAAQESRNNLSKQLRLSLVDFKAKLKGRKDWAVPSPLAGYRARRKQTQTSNGRWASSSRAKTPPGTSKKKDAFDRAIQQAEQMRLERLAARSDVATPAPAKQSMAEKTREYTAQAAKTSFQMTAKVGKNAVRTAAGVGVAGTLLSREARSHSRQKTRLSQQEQSSPPPSKVSPPPPSHRARVTAAQQHLDELTAAAHLPRVRRDLKRVEDELSHLAEMAGETGKKGAAVAGAAAGGSQLADTVSKAEQDWAEASEGLSEAVDADTAALEAEAAKVNNLLAQAMGGSRFMLNKAEFALAMLAGNVHLAHQRLSNQYQSVAQKVSRLSHEQRPVDWYIEHADRNRLGFEPNERIIDACRARHLPSVTDSDGMLGILYLTNRRILFDPYSLIHQAVTSIPLSRLGYLNTEDRPHLLLLHQELLILHLKSGSSTRSKQTSSSENYVFVLLDGAKNEVWRRRIGRARASTGRP
jgi:hypothetical protein